MLAKTAAQPTSPPQTDRLREQARSHSFDPGCPRILHPPPPPLWERACSRRRRHSQHHRPSQTAFASKLAPTVLIPGAHGFCIHHRPPCGSELARDEGGTANITGPVRPPSRASSLPQFLILAAHSSAPGDAAASGKGSNRCRVLFLRVNAIKHNRLGDFSPWYHPVIGQRL